MIIITTVREMQDWANETRLQGKRIGCVPTMGFLHKGHGSLISKAAAECTEVVVTIFVNPTQFGPNEDFERYPRNFERDVELAETCGATVIFHPTVSEMYPNHFSTTIHISGVTDKFEGVFRPNHFNGVATVVAKLLLATKPNIAYFGQKDYQQTLVIKRLVSDVNIDVEVSIQPTVREHDNLAMSSRNVYLSPEEREMALVLSQALQTLQRVISAGEKNRTILNNTLQQTIQQIPSAIIDYANVALQETLHEPDVFNAGDSVVALLAVRIGKTRLIDNMLFTMV
ncbi:MAG: pantoate--beta-alanine ligase [Candidatus Kapabacteria bacterium]|nr:pantoate--beta-alanine ligase [Candidatus Kapabacteria bacterium]